FGTKWPSITSTCKAVPPPSIAAWASQPSCAKLEARIDGNSSIFVMNEFALLPPELQLYDVRLASGPASISQNLSDKCSGPPVSAPQGLKPINSRPFSARSKPCPPKSHL